MNVGITGSIACGKSTVSNFLKKRGYIVIDADKVGHDILFNEEVKKRLVLNFGSKIIKNNEVDRVELGKIVFGNKKQLTLLNDIIHPEIRKQVLREQKKYKREKLVFLDVALLFEAKFNDLVDKIIVVHSNFDIQLERLMKRSSLSEKEALKRINSQISSEEKSKLGDYVIDNSSTLENTYNQLEEILIKLSEGENK
ncbi:dephospho-CoA kinase [Gemella cuniculi]|uniref:dephospho-CoA kinase n=1 Tax=Gemella cuniculi TaxID=150240 RepID=UPI0004125F67|nr:dephospho-CoA kinase [Gemella cuniculi]